MGTRGAAGFWKDGVHKVMYVHFDSYPEGLGQDMLDFVRGHTMSHMTEGFDALEMVTERDRPTHAQIAACEQQGLYDPTVSNRNRYDWYCLLRGAQGNLAKSLNVGLMLDGEEFLLNGLWCEYAYIINLSTGILEVYKGLNLLPVDKTASSLAALNGRYTEDWTADKARMSYDKKAYVGPLSCVAMIPLLTAAIPEQMAYGVFAEDEDELISTAMVREDFAFNAALYTPIKQP